MTPPRNTIRAKEPSTSVNVDNADHNSRIASLEAHFEHLATREDVEKLRTWSYSTMVSGIAAIISAGISVIALIGIVIKYSSK